MKAIFIADAHIRGLDDPKQNRLCSFLDSLKDIDRLFILGDLFDFWTRYSKVLEYHYSPLLARFRRLMENGTHIVYVEGNHDFSVGAFFKEILGGEVYPDFADINLNGKRLFLAHGDILEKSAGYKIWRGLLRSRILDAIVRITPPAFVWKVAMMLSKQSRSNNKRMTAMDNLQKEFARDKIKEGFDIVILGHSHIPGISEVTAEGRKGFYANPGDWIKEFSYLVWEDGGLRLERYKK